MAELYDNERQGEWAEEWIAKKDGLEHVPGESEWYDVINPRTNTKHEVKSATREHESGALGRFRLWEDQHRSLLASDVQNVAWYDFVLLSSSGTVLEHRRMKPTTVTKLIHRESSSGWNRAGHGDRNSRQHKLPQSAVFD